MSTQITETLARKVLTTIDAGLTKGVGQPQPGSMCVMAAINYAFGYAHGDNPTCVGQAVRSFDITINDAAWSSDEARAKGMRREAIAKLGSNASDQTVFASYVALHTIKRILPITLRAFGLTAEALLCEQATSLTAAAQSAQSAAESAARSAAWSAARSAESARSAAWSAAQSAWSAAQSAAQSAAESAAESAESAESARSAAQSAWSAAEARSASAESAAQSAWSAAEVAESAAQSAWSARSAAASASASASAESARDAILSLACDIAAEALIECGSEGTQWLWLCDEVTA